MFCHVNQPVSFLPESPETDMAPKVLSVDSLVMEQNLLLIHVKNVLALATSPMVTSHVLLKVFAGSKYSSANLASVHI